MDNGFSGVLQVNSIFSRVTQIESKFLGDFQVEDDALFHFDHGNVFIMSVNKSLLQWHFNDINMSF